MPSASSPVKDALESYVAGRVKAERLVVAVAAEYYRDAGRRGLECALHSTFEPSRWTRHSTTPSVACFIRLLV